MNGKFVMLLATIAASTFLSGNAGAHPGHSPADVTAQLSAPLAGPDHVTVFAVSSVLVALAAARLALYVGQRWSRARASRR